MPKPATLTDKAKRIAELAAEVLSRSQQINHRLWPEPTPERDQEIKQRVSPDTMPWLLEATEQCLIEAIRIVDTLQSKI